MDSDRRGGGVAVTLEMNQILFEGGYLKEEPALPIPLEAYSSLRI